jgi:hypothetical protein
LRLAWRRIGTCQRFLGAAAFAAASKKPGIMITGKNDRQLEMRAKRLCSGNEFGNAFWTRRFGTSFRCKVQCGFVLKHIKSRAISAEPKMLHGMIHFGAVLFWQGFANANQSPLAKIKRRTAIRIAAVGNHSAPFKRGIQTSRPLD